jgi:hypothetical protein
MTLSEAAKRGISRLRKPVWADEKTYLKIDCLARGKRGPWVHLYSHAEQNANGAPTPQSVLGGDGNDDYEEYTGLLDPADA